MKRQRYTTIQVSAETKKALDSMKKYRRETYNDVISRIIEDAAPMQRGVPVRPEGRVDEKEQKVFNSTSPPAEMEY